MDQEKSIAEGKANSLVQVDRNFLKKILSRKSFVGQSKRMFHTENIVSVPFDWELQPGIPKLPQTEIIAPIKPPPEVQNQTLETPSFASTHTKMSCFWKKSRKNYRQGKMIAKAKGRQGHFHGKGNNTPESVEFSDVNVDSMSTSDHSRSSSSSSSVFTSSSNSTGSSSNSSGLRIFAKGKIKWSF
ncbi:hypothetical protein CRYUN_Cryun02cG0110900 [Craigia yunnanensis]